MNDDRILESRMIRAARPVSSGSRLQSTTGGRVSASDSQTSAVIGQDGKVRRKWGPGDPWDSNYYFGGGDNG